jgi:DNA-directed RNA polymerase subunit RPC12/RpoP
MNDKRVGYYICIECNKKVQEWVGLPTDNNKVLCTKCLIQNKENYYKRCA